MFLYILLGDVYIKVLTFLRVTEIAAHTIAVLTSYPTCASVMANNFAVYATSIGPYDPALGENTRGIVIYSPKLPSSPSLEH